MTLVYAADETNEGITIDTDCLANGGCTWDIYDTLNIREEVPEDRNTFEYLTKDIFLTATLFIGTIVVFAIVFSGLLIVMGGASESTVDRGKQGVKRSLIGLVLVMFSYTIIRAVQFVAQGNS